MSIVILRLPDVKLARLHHLPGRTRSPLDQQRYRASDRQNEDACQNCPGLQILARHAKWPAPGRSQRHLAT
jgi:hypothetical protein